MQDRAYSVLEIRAVSDDERLIEGIATTPSTDRMGDVIEPLGARFAAELPLLWQHDHASPVGHVKFGKPTAKGIPFTANIVKIAEEGELKALVDKAWQSVKARLVRAVSIGFRPIEYSLMEGGGVRFLETEILELSLVTVPANSDCTITQIRSIDTQLRAASGFLQAVEERVSPGAPGNPAKAIPALADRQTRSKPMANRTVAEQITAYQSARETKAARMTEIMQVAADKGETLDAEATEEYDGLEAEVKSIDAHLKRLDALEKANAATAKPVDSAVDTKTGSEARAPARVEVKGANLPKGTAFTRYAMALARSKGNLMQAAEIAKGWDDSTPEVGLVLKAAVAAGTTTDAEWAAPLVPYNQMASEFIELLRPATVLGRIPNLRRVPFNISMPKQTGGSSVGWVGEGKPKPVSELAFGTETLRWAKAAGIVVLTDELVRFSNPAAEQVVRGDLIGSMAQFLDQQLLDPTVAAVTDVSPASLTNGVTPIIASGTDADALRADLQQAQANLITATKGIGGAVWLMSEIRAMRIAGMRNALGQREFPDLSAAGGVLEGLPVITSESVPTNAAGGVDPDDYGAGDLIVLVRAPEVFLADDGQVVLDASREASLQMNSTPDSPADADTVLVSLWQHNMVGLRAERWINWKKRRAGAVQYIIGANYGVAG